MPSLDGAERLIGRPAEDKEARAAASGALPPSRKIT
jgi:hypothetical protein